MKLNMIKYIKKTIRINIEKKAKANILAALCNVDYLPPCNSLGSNLLRLQLLVTILQISICEALLNDTEKHKKLEYKYVADKLKKVLKPE
jgi:hypothetical protein